MRTEYRIDDYQQNYFVIPSFDELLRVTVETDFAPLYAALDGLPDLGVADIAARSTGCSRAARRPMHWRGA